MSCNFEMSATRTYKHSKIALEFYVVSLSQSRPQVFEHSNGTFGHFP